MQCTRHRVEAVRSTTAVPAEKEALAYVDAMRVVDSGATHDQRFYARYREVLKRGRARVFLYGLAIGGQPSAQDFREAPRHLIGRQLT